MTPTPELPQVQSTAATTLIQPLPVQPDSISALVQPPTSPPAMNSSNTLAIGDMPAAERRTSAGPTEIPTENTPIEQLREQLPKPSFMTVTEPRVDVTPPTRAETPPPPPPAIPEFVNYTNQTFGAAPDATDEAKSAGLPASAPLQWLPPNTESGPASATGSRPMSPASRKQDLPVFTASSAIPFAPITDVVGQGVKKEDKEKDIWEVPETPAR